MTYQQVRSRATFYHRIKENKSNILIERIFAMFFYNYYVKKYEKYYN